MITYRPYIRESSKSDLNIGNPVIEIRGYKPKYTKEEEDEVIPVGNGVKEDILQREYQPRQEEYRFNSKEDFKRKMLPIYEELLIQRGLDPSFAKALVAQDGLESAWGSKPSGRNNFGGIKGRGTVKRTREVINGKDIYMSDSFRDFNSLEEYTKYKVDLLNGERYKAFSGKLNEFADRVQRGGYATDPNYSKVLKRVIQSVQFGGILNANAKNNVAYRGRQWVADWYKGRRKQIDQNYAAGVKFPIPLGGALAYNMLLHNMELTRAKVAPDIVTPGAKGEYWESRRKINFRDPSLNTQVHEWTHASRPELQEKAIANIIDRYNRDIHLGSVPDDPKYWDEPAEIYARMMEFREWAQRKLGYGPDHEWTTAELTALQKMYTDTIVALGGGYSMAFDKDLNLISNNLKSTRKDGTFDENEVKLYYEMDVPKEAGEFLNRYKPYVLKDLLNEVAKVDDKKKDGVVSAQSGMKFPKVGLRNSYNDDKELYDYSRGQYDENTGHWGSRGPESGMELKNPEHPTAWMSHETEKFSGNKRYQGWDGRYYAMPEWEAGLKNLRGNLGLREVGYPSYGERQATMEKSIDDNMPRIKWIYDQFIKAGATKEQAAAILGNWWSESRIQPDKTNSSTGAYGLAQLLGNRKKAYEDYLKNNGLENNTENQIKYLIPIIFGKEENPHNLENYNTYREDWTKGQRKKFFNSSGLEELTEAFFDGFEKASKKERDKSMGTRKDAARYIHNLIGKK